MNSRPRLVRSTAALTVVAGLLATTAAMPTRVALAQRRPRPAPAAATPATPAVDPRDEEARALFELGRTALSGGRFEDAVGYFERSYEVSGRPELLYNLGVANERLQREDVALDYFQRYIAALPDAPNRAEADARIAALRGAITQRQAAAEAAEREAARQREAPPPPRADEGGLLFTWIAGGAALALGGAAIGLGVHTNATYADLRDGCGARADRCSESEIDDSGVETFVTLTNVMLVGSLVALAGAVTLFFVEGGLGSDAESPTVAVSVGLGGVAVSGRF